MLVSQNPKDFKMSHFLGRIFIYLSVEAVWRGCRESLALALRRQDQQLLGPQRAVPLCPPLLRKVIVYCLVPEAPFLAEYRRGSMHFWNRQANVDYGSALESHVKKALCQTLMFVGHQTNSIYHSLEGSNFNLLHNSQWITFPVQSCIPFVPLY